MNTRSLFIVTGFLLCAGLAFCWIRTRRETRALIAERVAIASTQVDLERHATELKNEIATTTEKIAAKRLVAATSLTPVERARGAVGPWLARLKQAHAFNPPPARRPPPPSGPSGNVFPELMSDPEYNHLAAVVARQHVDQQNRPVLKKLGVPGEVINQVVDLLTEREMIFSDTRSILGGPFQGVPGSINERLMTLQGKIDANIHELLGDTAYEGFLVDIVTGVTTFNPDGTTGSKKVTRRGIPAYRAPPVDSRLSALERRLSYSPAPLAEAQKLTLIDWLTKAAIVNDRAWINLWQNEAFLRQARITLSPEQQAGLEELTAEADASEKRNKLPKGDSSPPKGKSSG